MQIQENLVVKTTKLLLEENVKNEVYGCIS